LNRTHQLDALRALAIFIVMLHHYTVRRMPLEGYGVMLFFVLSGYFTTATLLRLREKVTQHDATVGEALKQFYQRRWLRIVPAYLAVVLIAIAADVPEGRAHFISLLSFGANLEMLRSGEWMGRFSPLWSLAVLEQFYLFWPLALLVCPRRWTLTLLCCVIATAPLFTVFCAATEQPSFVWFMVPLAWFHQLGAGALLAWCSFSGSTERLMRVVSPLAALGAVGLILETFQVQLPMRAIYMSTLSAFFSIWLIARVSKGFGGATGWVFNQPFFTHVGRLSYGIFLLHNFTELLLPRVGLLGTILDSDWKFVVLMPCTILLADIMHRFFERPIIRFMAPPHHPPTSRTDSDEGVPGQIGCGDPREVLSFTQSEDRIKD